MCLPYFIRFPSSFALAGPQRPRDDRGEQGGVGDAYGPVLQRGQLQGGADDDGHHLQGPDHAGAHDERGSLQVVVQNQEPFARRTCQTLSPRRGILEIPEVSLTLLRVKRRVIFLTCLYFIKALLR